MTAHASVVDNLTADQRLPVTLLFVAFLPTFLITRGITRLIRAGKGPFRNNVTGGVHIHHAVPGIIATIGGAILAVVCMGRSPAIEVAAILIGVGASLVLDEFALIVHLQDVYWAREGQLSVQVVSLTAALLGLLTLGISPFAGDSLLHVGSLFLTISVPVHIGAVLVCVSKGKYSTAAVGAFLVPVALVGALRLARPHSRWARRRYSAQTMQRATDRAQRFDARYGQWGLKVEDLVAGAPE